MKKIRSLFILSFCALLFVTSGLHAQTSPEDYFVGTWKVKAFGLPQGDTDLVIQFEKKEGKLNGGLVDPATQEVTPFTKIDLVQNKVTAYFIAKEQAMEVYLTLEKKDDTNVTGSIMDMFNMEGTKAK